MKLKLEKLVEKAERARLVKGAVGLAKVPSIFLGRSYDVYRGATDWGKPYADKIIDPAALFVGGNLAVGAGINKIAELYQNNIVANELPVIQDINNFFSSQNEAELVGKLLGYSAIYYFANKKLILPGARIQVPYTSKRIKLLPGVIDLFKRKTEPGHLNSLKTALIGVAAAVYLIGSSVTSDVSRSINALSNAKSTNHALEMIFSRDTLTTLDSYLNGENLLDTLGTIKARTTNLANMIISPATQFKFAFEPRRVLPEYPLGNGGKYHAGAWEGYYANGLLKAYTGVSGRVPEIVETDFTERLSQLWKEKVRISPKNQVVEAYAKTVAANYEKNHKALMTLDDHIANTQEAIGEVNKWIDWKKVQSMYKLNDTQLVILRDICTSFIGRDINAYMMTELFDSTDGYKNKAAFDFLLRNAGKEFMDEIPALADNKTSKGMLQFTEYALFDTGEYKRGASIVNQALPRKYQIPGSVLKLEGYEHEKAGYLFAINNLAYMIGKLSSEQKNTLEDLWSKNHEAKVEFISTAHNQPTTAVDALKRHLDSKGTEPYASFLPERMQAYSEKTIANLEALYTAKAIKPGS